MQDETKTRTRKRLRIKPSELEYKEEKLKPTPLIFEQQHRNIATLIALMAAIIFGLGAGWMAGGFINGTINPTLPEPTTHTVEASQPSPDAEDTDSVDAAESNAQADSEPEARKENEGVVMRAASSRHVTYTARKGGESIPIKVLKGKPLKKVARQFKRLKVW